MTAVSGDDATLLVRLRAEIAMAETQLQRSRATQRVCDAACDLVASSNKGNGTISSKEKEGSPEVSQQHASAAEPSLVTSGSAFGMRRAGATHSLPPTEPLPQCKTGTLLHLVKGSFGSKKFVSHFIVIEEQHGVAWYQSEAHFRSAPASPLGRVPFWTEMRNSRGSRFKKAAVCWPLILPEDCPKADDPTKTYFAIEYLNEKNALSKHIFAAESEAERDNWVFFITQFIEMFLAPRAESEELQHLRRGAKIPQHYSEVIDGEAPGGTVP
ncbi:hypothetical protein DQ04_00031340 [Trypanosoma grayi]|uniref:hypothetical protein n=1 Tax=Trypanosoma grayi TaxID=71804 RepID=UPI0004F4682E|nr:hypothetical protein DQ04_00031340 [Trypanosoma grayi]KEG15600.1 hypothetical protein DQ04_00031340 [Trypanosoma grayi]